jgi:hypothetical protein
MQTEVASGGLTNRCRVRVRVKRVYRVRGRESNKKRSRHQSQRQTTEHPGQDEGGGSAVDGPEELMALTLVSYRETRVGLYARAARMARLTGSWQEAAKEQPPGSQEGPDCLRCRASQLPRDTFADHGDRVEAGDADDFDPWEGLRW